jgi:hypothetical protein
VVQTEFYGFQGLEMVEDALKKAFQKNGLPMSVCFEDSPEFNNDLIKRSRAKLNIEVLFARLYSFKLNAKVKSLKG